MSTLVKMPQQSLSLEFSQEKKDLIKKTYGKDLTDLEFDLFMSVATARGLDPVMGQIHAVKRRDGDGGDKRMTIQVAIDGFRLIAARTGEYAGRDEAKFAETVAGRPGRVTVTVYRMIHGMRCPFTATAKWSEYFPGENSKQAFMWKKMPETMLEKVCEAKALRMAFPGDLSDIYAPEEFDQERGPHASAEKVVEARRRFEEPKEEKAVSPSLPASEGGERFLAVKIDFKDAENRKRLKEMGFQWDATLKAWCFPETEEMWLQLDKDKLTYEVITK